MVRGEQADWGWSVGTVGPPGASAEPSLGMLHRLRFRLDIGHWPDGPFEWGVVYVMALRAGAPLCSSHKAAQSGESLRGNSLKK